MKCCDIAAGMLRTKVEFQRSTKVSDGAGGFTETWAAVAGAPTRAWVRSVTGREVWAFERTEARPVLRITVRYFSGLLESDRVVIRGKAYNITTLNNLEFLDRWLEVDLNGGVPT